MTTNSPEFPDEMKLWIGRCLARQETLPARLKFFNVFVTALVLKSIKWLWKLVKDRALRGNIDSTFLKFAA